MVVNTSGQNKKEKDRAYYDNGCPVYIIPPILPHLGHSHLASHSPCSCTEIQRFIQYKQITAAISWGFYSSILVILPIVITPYICTIAYINRLVNGISGQRIKEEKGVYYIYREKYLYI